MPFGISNWFYKFSLKGEWLPVYLYKMLSHTDFATYFNIKQCIIILKEVLLKRLEYKIFWEDKSEPKTKRWAYGFPYFYNLGSFELIIYL